MKSKQLELKTVVLTLAVRLIPLEELALHSVHQATENTRVISVTGRICLPQVIEVGVAVGPMRILP